MSPKKSREWGDIFILINKIGNLLGSILHDLRQNYKLVCHWSFDILLFLFTFWGDFVCIYAENAGKTINLDKTENSVFIFFG